MLCQHEAVSRASHVNDRAPGDRREQILDAALEVFGRQGFRQGSLKEIAASIGLTVQGLLHHFPTKEALLMATLERRNVQRSDRLAEIERMQGVAALMRVVLEENLENPGFMRLFVTLAAEATDPDHPAHEFFEQRYRRMHERIRSGLVADMQAGRAFAGIDVDSAADQIVALCDGLQLQYLLRPDMDLLAAYDQSVAQLGPRARDADVLPGAPKIRADVEGPLTAPFG